MLEWECTLNCNLRCKYCTNGRNDVLNKPIRNIIDNNRLKKFIFNLKQYKEEVFLFGGEPFLHPEISFIIDCFNEFCIPYVIQTNFTLIDKIKLCNLKENSIQISVHLDFLDKYNFEYLKTYYNLIRKIDIMFSDISALKIYREIEKMVGNEKLCIAPIADFKNDKKPYINILKKFNELKKMNLPFKFETGDRSFLWEKMMAGKMSTKGKKCMYLNIYKLFDPNLNMYNCSHRLNTEICPNNECFLM